MKAINGGRSFSFPDTTSLRLGKASVIMVLVNGPHRSIAPKDLLRVSVLDTLLAFCHAVVSDIRCVVVPLNIVVLRFISVTLWGISMAFMAVFVLCAPLRLKALRGFVGTDTLLLLKFCRNRILVWNKETASCAISLTKTCSILLSHRS